MNRILVRHRLLVVGLAGSLASCASFNDTVVVDVGDQFRLLEVAAQPSGETAQWRRNGFDCRFSAHGSRRGLFDAEFDVEGSLRCVPADAAPP